MIHYILLYAYNRVSKSNCSSCVNYMFRSPHGSDCIISKLRMRKSIHLEPGQISANA